MSAVIDYSVRRGEISAYGRALQSSKILYRYYSLATAALLILLACCALFILLEFSRNSQFVILLITAVAVAVSLWAIRRFTRQHFIEPDLAFRMWLQQVCDGELDARIGLAPTHRHYKELNFHTQNLALSLRRLSDDMDDMVETQTQRLSDQKRVVELLFKLTSDVSSEAGQDSAFETVCDYLADWFETHRIRCYRQLDNEKQLKCIALRNSSDAAVAGTAHTGPVPLVYAEQIPKTIQTVEQTDHKSTIEQWVPFFTGDEPAGVLILELDSANLSVRADSQRVLTTVSEQLSLLCEKQTVQEQMLEARLNRDRNELASEIHDSLAQTLLAIRYQTTLLSEKLKKESHQHIYNDVVKISGSIEEANEEIRGLIREYRNPLSEHRYADSLQVVIDEFSSESDIPIFFQSDDPQIRFTPREESVLQRVISEALNNTRKYANAKTIRVLLHREASGVRHILIEDDGDGFEQPETATSPRSHSGDHIGLTIMCERALSIGAKLSIDSEIGEGTRVTITMPPLIESRSNPGE